MPGHTPRLVRPDVALYDEWRAAHEEWGPGLHEDGFGLSADDDPSTPEGFAAWVAAVRDDPGGTLWWIVEGTSVAGGIALRADDHPAVARHGHVGYGIRPTFRGRGLATWALGEVLAAASARGMRSVHIVCAADNPASARVIERHGGRLRDNDDAGDADVRHYDVGTDLTTTRG